MSNPLKPTIKTEIVPVLAIIVSAVASFYFYAHFPARVVTHWGFNGEPNGWSSRGTAAFLFPAILIGMYFLFLLLPYIDPRKKRYEQFSKVYHIFKAFLILIMAGIYFVASLTALGFNLNVSFWTPLLVGLLFVILGNYMGKIKPNWFIGIRTPWTLSSEEVWNKTHRLGGKLFMGGGVLMMIMYFIPGSLRPVLFTIIILALVLGTVGYSYCLYRAEEVKKKHGEDNHNQSA